MAMQPKIGTEGVHFPSNGCFCREVTHCLARSRCAGVSSARHEPSHSPSSAHVRPASCVGILQIGLGKMPAGPQRPPPCSQASCVLGISKCDPHDFDGIGMLRITHGDPLVARASPVSSRMGNRCAAEPKDHHEQDAQAECSRGAAARRPFGPRCANGRRQERQISAVRRGSPVRPGSSVFPGLRPRGSPPRLSRPVAAAVRRRA